MKHIVFIPDIHYSNKFLHILHTHNALFHIIGKSQWQTKTNSQGALSTYWLTESEWNAKSISAIVVSIRKAFRILPAEIHLIGLNETSILLLGQVAGSTGCSGITLDESIFFRDKLEMMNRAASVGIRTPDTRKAANLLSADEFPPAGLILKPRFGVASRQVEYFSDYAAYRNRIEMLNNPDEFIIQTFIKGNIYFMNGLRIGNRTVKFCIGKYLTPLFTAGKLPGTHVKNWITAVPDKANKIIFDELFHLHEKIMNGFKRGDGCSHTEVFLSETNEFILCETAARPAGSHVQDMEKYVFGMKYLFEYWAQSIAGMPLPDKSVNNTKFVGLLAFTPNVAISYCSPISGFTDSAIIQKKEIAPDEYQPGEYSSYVSKLIIECNDSKECEEKLTSLCSEFQYETRKS